MRRGLLDYSSQGEASGHARGQASSSVEGPKWERTGDLPTAGINLPAILISLLTEDLPASIKPLEDCNPADILWQSLEIPEPETTQPICS